MVFGSSPEILFGFPSEQGSASPESARMKGDHRLASIRTGVTRKLDFLVGVA